MPPVSVDENPPKRFKADDLSKHPIPFIVNSAPTIVQSSLVSTSALTVYWLGAHQQGDTIYLLGKVLLQPDKYVNCCIRVHNCTRSVYLVPRPGVSEEVMLQEAQQLCNIWRINVPVKLVQRHYAFELDSVPHGQSTFIKLETAKPIAMTANKVFSCMIGASTKLLEAFLLKLKHKGPCWLSIQSVKQLKPNEISWTSVDFEVNNPKHISVLHEQQPCPPLTILCLQVQFNKSMQIIMIHGICHSDATMDAPLCNMNNVRQFRLVQQSCNDTIPNATICPNESTILELFANQLHYIDPDVVASYNLSYDLHLLLERMKAHNMKNWSRIGRLKQFTIPSWQEHYALVGRLVSDIKHIATQYYNTSDDLSSLARVYIPTSEQLHADDAYLILLLIFKWNILNLATELASIVGNIWSNALSCSRSEKIEYMLLHAFFSSKFIVPDKQLRKESCTSYQGSHILDVHPGLYRQCVLKLDFTSLYPSIIREYHICYCTVDHRNADLPSVPNAAHPYYDKAILPQIMQNLIQTRNAIKEQLKHEQDMVTIVQLTVKQRVLKLIAASTYGCIGSQFFRFYCKPIAALITSKGRDILQDTVDVISKLNFKVLYGHTDSVMILTPCTEVKKALQVAKQIQHSVNSKYQHLVIAIEGTFCSLLLVDKIKYAGILYTTEETSTVEMKGVVAVIQSQCQLVRSAYEYCLKQILTGTCIASTTQWITQYLQQYLYKIQKGEFDLTQFVMRETLNNNIADYKDISKHNHVKVAKELQNQGIIVCKGDSIPYIMCTNNVCHPAQVATASQINKSWYMKEVQSKVQELITMVCAFEATENKH